MIRRCTTLLGLSVGLLTGCVSVPGWSAKPAPLPAPAAIEEAANRIPNPDDPVRPQMMSKLTDFLSGQGLTLTAAQPGQTAQITAAWNNKIVYAADPTRGGEPTPGLIARLWIFGPDEAVPLDPDGELIVGVWDNAPRDGDGQPVPLELWHIDRETARQFSKRDFMGYGYSLFLPWSKYHVDLKQVNVMVRYNGVDGRCVASAPQVLTLDHSATLQRAAEKLGLKSDLIPPDGPPGLLPPSAMK